jgi:DNA-binding GntR family transcriptional regulator
MEATPSGRTRRSASLTSRIHRDLRERIHRGGVAEDERLVDTEIAARLGVSRMPVREALLRLTHEGYLVGTTRGFMLPRLTRADVADVFEVRRLLEPRAAAHAARDLDAAGRADLAAAAREADEAARAGDADRLHAANVRFRAGWLAAVSNRRLASALARFADQVQVVRLRTLGDPPTQRLVADHLALLADAFARGDSVAAADRTARFVDLAEETFLKLTGPDRTTGRPSAEAAA